MQEIECDLYIDELIGGGSTVQKASKLKDMDTEILNKAAFQLHKWKSNVPELELEELQDTEDSMSFANLQLVVKAGECGLLGLKWDKTNDTLAVEFPADSANSTRRGILSKLAKIYDPLGNVFLITFRSKLLYQEVYELYACPIVAIFNYLF